MENLKPYVENAKRFSFWSHAEKIIFFAWFCQKELKLTYFSPSNIRSCYIFLSLDQPSNVNAYFHNFSTRKPKKMIKNKNGYTLEKSISDEADLKYGKREITVKIEKDISNLPSNVKDFDEKEFLNEVLICFKNGAFRSTIVMTWNLAFSHLCNWIYINSLADFNIQLPKSYPKADILAISSLDHFSILKEGQIIQVAKSANIISNDVYKILNDKLGKRNSAAHPSKVKITQYQAEEYITDLINNVVIKLV
jgi:hypothetical protein